MKVELKKTQQQTTKPRKTSGQCFYLIWRLYHQLSRKKKKDEVMELDLHTPLREFPYRNLDNIKLDININLVFLTF